MDFLEGFSPVVQALIATGFTWFVTALGAGLVFFFKTIHRKILDSMLGFAAIGTMLGFAVMMLLDVALG